LPLHAVPGQHGAEIGRRQSGRKGH
jgi:hypothetical protein